jgi:hypothetical protein
MFEIKLQLTIVSPEAALGTNTIATRFSSWEFGRADPVIVINLGWAEKHAASASIANY